MSKFSQVLKTKTGQTAIGLATAAVGAYAAGKTSTGEAINGVGLALIALFLRHAYAKNGLPDGALSAAEKRGAIE